MPDRTIDFYLPLEDWGEDAGEVLTAREAAKILADRLDIYQGEVDTSYGKPTMTVASEPPWALVQKLVQLLPPEQLTEKVMMQMDMRALMSPVLATEYQAQREGAITINGVTFEPEERIIAGGEFIGIQRKLRDQLQVQLQTAGFPLDEVPALVENEMNRFRESPGMVLPLPVVQGQLITDPTTGAVQTAGASADTNDFATQLNQLLGAPTGEEAIQLPAFLTKADLQLMLMTDEPGSVIGRFVDDLSLRQEYRAAGAEGVPTEQRLIEMGQGFPSATLPSPAREGRGPSVVRDYTLTQALQMPLNLTAAEVKALSDKMERAGLYAQIDGGAPSIKSDPTDPQFKKAYRLLLAKSIERGRPVSTILQEDSLEYEEAVSNKARASLTDPARIRIAANTIAQSTIGRKLTDQESARYIQTMHSFQHDQAVQTADEEGGDVVEVDWEARMQEAIRTDYAPEAGAKDAANQYDVFKDLLSGPGRGTGI